MVIASDSRPVASGVEIPPRLDPGLELLGEYQGSGYREPPSLVRRSDGQILQLPPLLYQVLKAIDGERGSAEIAAVVGDEVQRGLASDDIDFLINEKLRPQHLVAEVDGSSNSLPRSDPFLAFRYRIGVVSERVSGAAGRHLYAALLSGRACHPAARPAGRGLVDLLPARRRSGVAAGVVPSGPLPAAAGRSHRLCRPFTRSGMPAPAVMGAPGRAAWDAASTSPGLPSTPMSAMPIAWGGAAA